MTKKSERSEVIASLSNSTKHPGETSPCRDRRHLTKQISPELSKSAHVSEFGLHVRFLLTFKESRPRKIYFSLKHGKPVQCKAKIHFISLILLIYDLKISTMIEIPIRKFTEFLCDFYADKAVIICI